MSKYRINVLGASGCGASTLGRALSESLSIGYFDSDDYYHAPSDPPFQHQRSAEDRHALLTHDLRPTESWVLGGGVAGWVPYPDLRFSCIVFLYTPVEVRLERLRHRERQRFGDRILEGGDMHDTHTEFIHWASRYDAGDVDGKTLQRHQEYLDQQLCPVIKDDGRRPVADLVENVLAHLSAD